MAQQGKQMRVGAREGFAYHSSKLVYWLTVTGMMLVPIRFFLRGEALYPFKVLPSPNSDLS
jgi:hypothetical protein